MLERVSWELVLFTRSFTETETYTIHFFPLKDHRITNHLAWRNLKNLFQKLHIPDAGTEGPRVFRWLGQGQFTR